MGTINHNAILATTWDGKRYKEVVDKIECSETIYPSGLFAYAESNFGFYTVVMTPDGSKEGWPDSKAGDTARQAFIDLLTTFDHIDGSNSWKWIEVGYGEYGQKVLRGNCKNRYSETEYHRA